MKQYESCIFDSYSFDLSKGKIALNYSLDDEVKFTETIEVSALFLDYARNDTLEARSSKLEASLFALHLIGGISYFKTCLPKNIVIRSGALTETQAAFWNTVYTEGLGEFFYKNGIDFRGVVKFPVTAKTKDDTPNPNPNPNPNSKILVPLGGGKDSLVTVELLKKQGHSITLFRLGAHPVIEQLAKIAGLPLLTVKRCLSPELFRLNEEGALNGHVPITAYLSILSIFVAELTGHTDVVMSNEASATEGNVMFHGKEINHQWSKGIVFEQMLQQYLQDSIGSTVQYSSLLRPYSELQIVEMFCRYPEYFEHFTSCNTNWKIGSSRKSSGLPREALSAAKSEVWCGSCPKCAFAFCLFAAYLPLPTLLKIFGKNLFEDTALLSLYRELLGLQGFKPFECVGTPEETKEAFRLAHERGELEGTPVMEMFLQETRDARVSTNISL